MSRFLWSVQHHDVARQQPVSKTFSWTNCSVKEWIGPVTPTRPNHKPPVKWEYSSHTCVLIFRAAGVPALRTSYSSQRVQYEASCFLLQWPPHLTGPNRWLKTFQSA